MLLSSSEADSRISDIPDADVVKGNKRFLLRESDEVASKLWEKASFFGAQGGGQNCIMVEAIISTEQRDKLLKDQKVYTKGGKS